MENDILYKIVFEDKGERVLRGYVELEEEFCYKIKAEHTNEIIILGKRAIIKMQRVDSK